MGERSAAALRFEVLGPLRAWSGDVRPDLGPVQRRVVLATLLLHANRPVGRAQILDAVWGPAAPTYAVNLLQKHVSALRRALEPARSDRAPSQLLTWTDAGYLLTVPAGALDLEVFEAQVSRGRAEHAAGRPAAAADALRTALALWRGPVCDGLTSPFLDAERERLAERRITVIEERIEVELALGSHPDLVAELRQLVGEQPLRERLRGLLMLALYRAGRQADALTAYQDARRHLLDELGVEPSPELQRLHQRVLAGDPALAPAAAAEVVHRPPTPAQLPYGMPDFTGRQAELDRLQALLAAGAGADGAGGRIVAITGTAGVGKTSLAVHWAQQVRDRFPDGQLYVNLRGFDPTGSAMETAEAIRGFLDAFAVPPQMIPVSVEAQGALLRSLLAGRRVLLVLDNARNADQVRPLLPGSPGCLVVVTSRDQLTGLVAAEAAHAVAIDMLAVGEARQLLSRRLGQERVAAEPRAVEEIIASCARLPLVLAIVAGRAATRPTFPLAALATQLREARGSLDAFDGEDWATDVRALFSWSYRTLSDEAARMFRLLALHPGPHISAAAAASLAGISRREAGGQLAALARAHLVVEQSPDRFAVHDLLRAYAAEQGRALDSDAVRREALGRMFDYYLHSAYAANWQLSPHRDQLAVQAARPGVTLEAFADQTRAMAWFVAEHPVLLATVQRAASAGFDVHAWQLTWAFMTFFDRRGHWRDTVATQRVALAAAQRLGDLRGRATAHRWLAKAFLQLERGAEARQHLRHAIDLFGRLDDRIGLGRTRLSLAMWAEQQGRHSESLDHAWQAVEIYRATDNRAGQADALNAVGWYLAQLGRPEEALGFCQEALVVHQEIGDREGEESVWDSLGYVYERLGKRPEAIACNERARRLAREVGKIYYEASLCIRLGDLYAAAGDVDSARADWQRALTILDDFGHPDADLVTARLVSLSERGITTGHRVDIGTVPRSRGPMQSTGDLR